jgi:GMP synthase-like glutamine amidotransferase
VKILFLQHADHEGPLLMAKWAADRGHLHETLCFFRGEKPPAPETFDVLVVMGGPMGVYEEARYPWLAEEKRFIQRTLSLKRKAIGVCLGSQLLAEALGGKVYANQVKEIGWFPIQLTEVGKRHRLLAGFPEKFPVVHWHGDTFDLPSGAVWLASSEACSHQAYLAEDRVLGLQFHLETTRADLANWIEVAANDLEGGGPYVQIPQEILAAPFYDEAESRMRLILDRFLCD